MHPALPQGMAPENMAIWFESNSTNRKTDTERVQFTSDQIVEFEHESSAKGREINRLEGIKTAVSEMMNKGTANATVKIVIERPDAENPKKKHVTTFVVPATAGIKMLTQHRKQNDDNVERGYLEEVIDIFEVPYFHGKSMEYFTIDGTHLPERSRPMSVKEQHEHRGLFAIAAPEQSLQDAASY